MGLDFGEVVVLPGECYYDGFRSNSKHRDLLLTRPSSGSEGGSVRA